LYEGRGGKVAKGYEADEALCGLDCVGGERGREVNR
jgi:hypothetical protein